MSQSQSLQLKQGQSLVMTQQLQQSIKLLQYNAVELSAFIASECEQNPFLVATDPGGEAEATENLDLFESEVDERADRTDSAEQTDAPVSEITATEAATEQSYQEADTGSAEAETWEYTPSERITITPRDGGGDLLEFADTKERKLTLKEHLMQQLPLEISDPTEQRIGAYLIDLVDEAGYIKEPIAIIAQQLGTAAELVETVLLTLQHFDPAGIGARHLSECLSLQLAEQNRLDPAMQCLLDHLDLLGAAKLDVLQKKCGVDADDLRDMITEIKGLNPKPGLVFEPDRTEVAMPDIIVNRGVKNKWTVELNSATLPKVLVNRRYHSQIVIHADGVDKKYISEQMNNANWLVKALDQRANTIVKVATELIVQQEAFFKMGIHHLKPLTLKEIASATGYHESTISRVTTGKYMMTPRGLFELKYFFTSSLSHRAGGDDVSSQTVKHLIKEIIDREMPEKPFSDDDIAAKLKVQNIQVARRTVAKYREALHLPSSMQRKRLKAV